MTRDDIIKLAREAGMTVCRDEWVFGEMLERFAALVAAAEREAIADELEHGYVDDEGHHIQYAAAIRARGQDPMPLFDDWNKDWK